MKTAFLFPGQGSQEVGMGEDLVSASAAARDVFERADQALGFSLSTLCFAGPAEELTLTENTQPAILTTSIAVLAAAREKLGSAALVAGHSLGEYSALVAAGSIPLDDAVRLVRRRGQLMQEAVAVGSGAMAAVLGLDAAAVEEVAEEASQQSGALCQVANYNSPLQIVLAGERAGIERAVELAKEKGAKRSMLLDVSAPFHCSLMAPAREEMTPLLAEAPFVAPSPAVVCNVDARPVNDADSVRDALVRQIDRPVRWVESIEAMIASGIERFVEIGPGKVLSGLVKRIDRGVCVSSISSAGDL